MQVLGSTELFPSYSGASDLPSTLASSSYQPGDRKVVRPRSKSHHLHPSNPAPPRWWLHVQASFWRSLMSCSMFLHDWASPRPPRPAFTRSIPTEYDHCSSTPIILYFYVPPDYHERMAVGHRYPVVINFHGGGFCLGDGTDDRYWANVVLGAAHSIFVSVNYRRAPEFSYPTAVDDGVAAIRYLSTHASELGLDVAKVALSGFSAGANLAFSVPLRLSFGNHRDAASNSDHTLSPSPSTQKLIEAASCDLNIVNIIAFYPLLDWSVSRNSKRLTSRKPEKTLPRFFADLFDYSYLPPSKTEFHVSPFVSPGLAPDHMLVQGLPDDIQIFLCEWDMLLKEGEIFAQRLDSLGKKVRSTLIPGAVHGWDKDPNPWRDQESIDRWYEHACEGLGDCFGKEEPRDQ